jgi:CheY-like chemotaxis protein
MDGFEFSQRLKVDERLANIPVVVVTAKTLNQEEKHILSTRTQAVIAKQGMKTADLLSEIAGIVDSKAKDSA